MRAFELTLPASAPSLRIVRQALSDMSRSWDSWSTDLQDAQLAVTEACANVVMHAYPDRDDGVLQVTGEVDGPDLRVSVQDQGTGMKPRTDSPGLGIGLPLIVALTDELEIGTTSCGRGNDVRMTFRGGGRHL